MSAQTTRLSFALLSAPFMLVLAACSGGTEGGDDSQTLAEARAGRDAGLTAQQQVDTPAPLPPEGVLEVVRYPTELGDMVGYLTPNPDDGQKHPAMIWISGGDQTIGDFWTPQDPKTIRARQSFAKKGSSPSTPLYANSTATPVPLKGFMAKPMMSLLQPNG